VNDSRSQLLLTSDLLLLALWGTVSIQRIPQTCGQCHFLSTGILAVSQRPLSSVALDLVSAPAATQAYTERIFSVWGDLTTSKSSRTRTSLGRVFLKPNMKIA